MILQPDNKEGLEDGHNYRKQFERTFAETVGVRNVNFLIHFEEGGNTFYFNPVSFEPSENTPGVPSTLTITSSQVDTNRFSQIVLTHGLGNKFALTVNFKPRIESDNNSDVVQHTLHAFDRNSMTIRFARYQNARGRHIPSSLNTQNRDYTAHLDIQFR